MYLIDTHALLWYLPDHHKDPFDRLIVAQAKCENLAIITRDAIIPKYDVKTVW